MAPLPAAHREQLLPPRGAGCGSAVPEAQLHWKALPAKLVYAVLLLLALGLAHTLEPPWQGHIWDAREPPAHRISTFGVTSWHMNYKNNLLVILGLAKGCWSA